MSGILDTLGGSIVVKTQYGPPITVYQPGSSTASPGLFSQLVDLGIQVQDSNGNVLASVGDWPDTNPAAAAALLAVVAGLLYFAVKGLRS